MLIDARAVFVDRWARTINSIRNKEGPMAAARRMMELPLTTRTAIRLRAAKLASE